MLHFLTGAAYTGKTKALFNLTRTLAEQKKRVLFLVPEQQTASTEADLLRHLNNRAGEVVEVLNFQRLPNRIFREVGGVALPSASRTQKSLLITRILQEEAATLPYFSSHRKNADFIREVTSFLEEVSRSGISAEALFVLAESPHLAHEGSLPEKLKEAALVYASYDALYRKLCGKCPDDEARLANLLNHGDVSFFENLTVILDGFYDFTAPQYDLICHMAKKADEVYLSILDDGRDSLLFSRTRACRNLLCARMTDADYDVLTPEDLGVGERTDPIPQDLAFLCDHILTKEKAPFEEKPEHLALSVCKTAYDEVLCTFKEVVRLHEEEGVPYADCAVLYRDKALYAPLLKELAGAYALPLYTDEQTALSDSPLSLFFSAAAAIAAGDDSAAPLLQLLSSGLCPLTHEATLYFERYIRTWRLSGDALYSANPYTASIYGLEEIVTRAQEEENCHVLQTLNREKGRLLRPLSRLKDTFSSAASAREKNEALFAFAEEVHANVLYAEKIDSARADGRFSEAATLQGLFDALLTAFDAVGATEGETEPAFYNELLRLAFSFESVGALPSSPEALCAGDVTFTRLKKVRHLFLIGVCSDTFPKTSVSLPLISVRERTLISALSDNSPLFFAKPAEELTREEYFLFYLAASVPREKLHLSYHTQDLNGDTKTPSAFISRVKALFPALPEQTFDAKDALPTTPDELYNRLLPLTPKKTDAARALWEETTKRAFPPSDEEEAALRDFATPAPSGTTINISQAKLAGYAECPYAYFLRYVLFLSEEKVAEPSASLRGTIIHSVLEHLLTPLSEGRLFKPKLDAINAEKVDAEFNRLHEELKEAGFVFDACDETWFSDLRRCTKRLVFSIKEELLQGKWRPTLFEADLLRTLTPVERALSNDCRMRISGKADRIDLSFDAETGKTYARVVDYKTGAHTLDATAVYNGLDTQLLLYLFTLSENGLGRERKHILPAAAYYLHSYDTPKSLTDTDLKRRENDPDYEIYTFKRSGIFLFDEDALSLSTPQGADAPAACLPVQYGKNGPKASGILANEEEFALLKDAVFAFAEDTAEDILSARFERRPLKKDEEKNDACEYCPYHAICRYENEACRTAETASADTLFEQIQKGGIYRG